MFELFAYSALAIAVFMLGIWLVSLWLRDVSIVDIGWGLGFVLVAWLSFLVTRDDSTHGLTLALLSSVWGIRLSGYLAWRNWGEPEDKRYGKMRDRWGDKFPWVSLLTVFGLQGVIMWIVSLPLQVGQLGQDGPLTVPYYLGVLIWLIGLCFESLGDLQLARFKARPENQGEVMDRGLWRYTRHPNYFGDFLVWWGFYLISLTSLAHAWTVISPLLMSFLLIRVSGVRLLESHMEERGGDYARYKRRTSVFFPWPPAKASTRCERL